MHVLPEDKRTRREVRVLKLLEQVRVHVSDFCYLNFRRDWNTNRGVSTFQNIFRNNFKFRNNINQVREFCDYLEGQINAACEGDSNEVIPSLDHPNSAVAALMKLSFDEEHRHAMCQLGSYLEAKNKSSSCDN